MKNNAIVFIISICFWLPVFSQQSNKIKQISENIELIKISENVFIHKTYSISKKWGRISANGLIYFINKKAFLFDTPWTDAQTEELVTWLQDSLQVKVNGFIPSHWHEDCIGGLAYIKRKGIKSYANQMTIDIAKEKGLAMPDNGFSDSLQLFLHEKEILCYYFGAAHSIDNIVIWLPSEKVLFAGCAMKGMEYNNIGFTGDGDLKEYPNTLKKILDKFPNAKLIVPGHGNYAGIELIHHNIKLTRQ